MNVFFVTDKTHTFDMQSLLCDPITWYTNWNRCLLRAKWMGSIFCCFLCCRFFARAKSQCTVVRIQMSLTEPTNALTDLVMDIKTLKLSWVWEFLWAVASSNKTYRLVWKWQQNFKLNFVCFCWALIRKTEAMGYEVERFAEKVNDNYICSICTEVFKDPIMLSFCEHIYCRECIEEWFEKSQNCPEDRRPATASDLKPPSRFFRNLYNNLKMHCDYFSNGCKVAFTLDQINSHVKICQFNPNAEVSCFNNCGAVVSKSKLLEHNCVAYLKEQLALYKKESSLIIEPAGNKAQVS